MAAAAKQGGSVEVRIGVQHSSREITLDSASSPEDIAAAVSKALSDGSILALEDDKGRKVLVPGDRIAYVEVSPAPKGRVGFGG